MKKIALVAIFAVAMESAALLPQGNWEPSVRDRLNEVIERNKGNPDAYAVFDFDYTTAIGDLSYVCMWKILERLDLRTDDVHTMFTKDIPQSHMDEATALANIVTELKPMAGQDLTENQKWRMFIKRYWTLYRRLYDDIGEYRAYLWRTRVFMGYTPDEMKSLAKRAITDELKHGRLRRDKNAPKEKRGLAFTPELKELFRELRNAGISVYIVSGSFQETLLVATGPEFGFDLDPSCVFGAQLKTDANGRFLPEMKEGCVKSRQKPAFIRKNIAPRHHGAEPILAAGDSMGDYSMLTEFKNLQLALLFRRDWREQEMHDLAASGGKIAVQGRDETQGKLIPSHDSIFPNKKK